jgi:phospholipid-binding lipoprotein MlaA
MSFSALTTAMAVAAAPVPSGGAPAPVAAFGFESVAFDQTPPLVGPEAGSVEVSPPVVPAQSTEPPQSTETAQLMEPAPSTDPASSAQPESQAPAPAAGPGEIVVTGRRASPDDPLEELNSTSFEVTQTVDKAIVAPVAFAYKEVMPRPIRSGLRNFLHNLGEPVVFLNFMLQLKPDKAAETLGRFAINTTLGAAGLVDIAKRKPFNLPYRRNGFANTLGYYGVKPGPYFYLPLVGSTTLRDFIGNRVDLLVLPLALGRSFNRPEFVIPVAVLSELDHRIEFDDELSEIRAKRDPYVAARIYYLQKRQAEIDALHDRGDSTIPATVPAPTSSDPIPAPTSPAPAQDLPPGPSFTGQ